LPAIAAHPVFDRIFELEAHDDRTAEGVASHALPFVLVVNPIEVVAGVARGVGV
jgi:hypothetical protein